LIVSVPALTKVATSFTTFPGNELPAIGLDDDFSCPPNGLMISATGTNYHRPKMHFLLVKQRFVH
jgi:hypothetical protein